MRYRLVLAALLFFIGGLSVACGGSGNTGPLTGTGLVVKSVQLYRDNGSGEAGDQVTSFKPSDRVQHFELTANNLVIGQKARWVFTAVDTGAGKDIEIVQVTTDILFGNKLAAQISLTKDWPVGKYRADVYLGDSLVKSVDYAVE